MNVSPSDLYRLVGFREPLPRIKARAKFGNFVLCSMLVRYTDPDGHFCILRSYDRFFYEVTPQGREEFRNNNRYAALLDLDVALQNTLITPEATGVYWDSTNEHILLSPHRAPGQPIKTLRR